MSGFLLSVWVCILPCHQRLFKLQSPSLRSHIQLLRTGYFSLDVKNFLRGHCQGLLSENQSMRPLNPLICLLFARHFACSNRQRCFLCYFSTYRFSSGISGSVEQAVNLTLMYYHLIKLMLLMFLVDSCSFAHAADALAFSLACVSGHLENASPLFTVQLTS